MFKAALREAIECAQARLQQARRDGRPYEETAQAARLLDLVDRARDSGVDTTGWVRQEVMADALAKAGNGP
jgi:hypothetical protein